MDYPALRSEHSTRADRPEHLFGVSIENPLFWFLGGLALPTICVNVFALKLVVFSSFFEK